MKFTLLSLFPDYFVSPFNESILKRAQKNGLIQINQVNIRDFSSDKHHKADDRPYGGGPGMVLMPEPISKAIQHVKTSESKVIYLSPQGKLLTAKKCQELAQEKHLILLCGHYEGIDERVLTQQVDEEISIGDYVLTNGGIAAILLVDAVARFIPGVLGDENSACNDSFHKPLFDHPHYTRPEKFNEENVPDVLLEGHHAKIEAWRHREALQKTYQVRPDLYAEYVALSQEEARVNITLPVKDLPKSERFFKKIFKFENGKIFFEDVAITLVPTLNENANSRGIVLEFKLSDHQLVLTLSRKFKNSENLIKETEECLIFNDLDGYIWHFIKPNVKILNELKT